MGFSAGVKDEAASIGRANPTDGLIEVKIGFRIVKWKLGAYATIPTLFYYVNSLVQAFS